MSKRKQIFIILAAILIFIAGFNWGCMYAIYNANLEHKGNQAVIDYGYAGVHNYYVEPKGDE